MKQKFKIIGLFFLFAFGQTAFAQVDNYAKNSKLSKDEQTRFEDELKSNKDSAEVYWKHANVLASFTFNAKKNAWKFYEKAISIDSSRVKYFIDYGNYLFNVLNETNKAKDLYERGLKIFPNDNDLKLGLEKISNISRKIEENIKMSSIGKASTNELSKATDFENLIKQTKNKKSKFYYKKLLDEFNSDITLTNEQIYMLLLGLTQQDNYNPYGQESEEIYQLNSQENFDKAIIRANELIKTNPLQPSLYKEIVYAYRKIGNITLADKYLKKLQSILNAMLYVGEGTCEKPYIAFWLQSEYIILEYLDYEKSGAVNSVPSCGQMIDQIEVTNSNTKNQSVICFNIALIFKKLMNK